MQIKRFEAKNLTDALRQIKRELGSEAVILSAKDIRKENRLLGVSRKIGVQVTAAVDDLQLLLELGWTISRTDHWPEWKPGAEFRRQ